MICKACDRPRFHITEYTATIHCTGSEITIKTSWYQSHSVATLIHPQIGIVVLNNKLLHFLPTLQFAASSFPSRGVSLGLDVSYISLFFLRGSFWA